MRKITIFFLVCVALFSSCSSPTKKEKSRQFTSKVVRLFSVGGMKGDFNTNGKLDTYDAQIFNLVLLNHPALAGIWGNEFAGVSQSLVADMNTDGSVDGMDIQLFVSQLFMCRDIPPLYPDTIDPIPSNQLCQIQFSSPFYGQDVNTQPVLVPSSSPVVKSYVPFQSYRPASQGSPSTAPVALPVAQGPMFFGLPQGLSFSGQSLSGIPSVAGNYNFYVYFKDPMNRIRDTQQSSFIVAVYDPLVLPSSLPSISRNVAYNAPIAVSGGLFPITVTLSGTLPSGLLFYNNQITSSNSLSSPVFISGTPTDASTTTFVITAKDSAQTPQIVSQTYTLSTCEQIVLGDLNQTVVSLNSSTVLSFGIVPKNDNRPYTVSVISGNVPSGKIIQLRQGFSKVWDMVGTFTTRGTYNMTIQVMDSKGCTTSKQYQILVQ